MRGVHEHPHLLGKAFAHAALETIRAHDVAARGGFVHRGEQRGFADLAFVGGFAGAWREEAWSEEDHRPEELGEEREAPVHGEEDDVVADDVERRLPSPRDPGLERLFDAGEVGGVARGDVAAGVSLEECRRERLDVVEHPLADVAEDAAGEAAVDEVAEQARRGGDDGRDTEGDEDLYEDVAVAGGDGVVDEAAEGHRDEGVERHVHDQAGDDSADGEGVAAEPASEADEVGEGTH